MSGFLTYLGAYLALCGAATLGYFVRGWVDRLKADGRGPTS